MRETAGVSPLERFASVARKQLLARGELPVQRKEKLKKPFRQFRLRVEIEWSGINARIRHSSS
jgi:hypothetical protein